MKFYSRRFTWLNAAAFFVVFTHHFRTCMSINAYHEIRRCLFLRQVTAKLISLPKYLQKLFFHFWGEENGNSPPPYPSLRGALATKQSIR
ncbi:MAG: hypothetical protein LBP54_01055 [Campylobacteraceae bacterium]|nr:hypothetical protein [Campylobacteraceae bacterium]